MSFMERVKCASGAFGDGAGPGIVVNDEIRFEEFKNELAKRLSPQQVAGLIERNAVQARNEIRLACEDVIAASPWLATGELGGDALIEKYLDLVFGLGPLEPFVEDDSVTEVMVNGFNSVFYERDGVLYRSDSSFVNDEQVKALIDRILAPLGRRIDESSPMVNARLAQGHRVNAVIPPLALDGPILTIRKFRTKVLSLDEMRSMGSFDESVQKLMAWSVLKRCNIAVTGGTGSGKTTLLNALSCVIPHGERIITIEDSAELRFFEHPHVVRLEARPRNAEGFGEVTIRDLVINSLRMRPDRIVVGECRGAEALDMLQAMNTGHDGSLTTLHANSPKEAIARLTTMVRYGADLPVSVIEAQIGSAMDVVVHTSRTPSGKRKVTQVGGLFLKSDGVCDIETYYEWDLVRSRGVWRGIPDWVDDLPFLGLAEAKEVDEWKKGLSLAA